MKRILGIVVLAAALSGCYPTVLHPDPQDPRVEEILTRPGLDEDGVKAAFEKLFDLPEGSVVEVRQEDGKLEVEVKSPEAEATEAAADTFFESIEGKGVVGGLVTAGIVWLTVWTRRKRRELKLSEKKENGNGE